MKAFELVFHSVSHWNYVPAPMGNYANMGGREKSLLGREKSPLGREKSPHENCIFLKVAMQTSKTEISTRFPIVGAETVEIHLEWPIFGTHAGTKQQVQGLRRTRRRTTAWPQRARGAG